MSLTLCHDLDRHPIFGCVATSVPGCQRVASQRPILSHSQRSCNLAIIIALCHRASCYGFTIQQKGNSRIARELTPLNTKFCTGRTCWRHVYSILTVHSNYRLGSRSYVGENATTSRNQDNESCGKDERDSQAITLLWCRGGGGIG